jgi:hypothetical protein
MWADTAAGGPGAGCPARSHRTRTVSSGSTASVTAVPETGRRPALQLGPVVEAARAAVRPPGPLRWTADRHIDRVDLHLVIRRWSAGTDPSARLARLACGTALRAARLAVAVQGHRPVVSWPDHRGLLAVLHAGDVAAPRREDALLHAVLRGAYAPQLFRRPSRTAALQQLRRAAETEGAWLRVPDDVPGRSPALGPCWDDPDDAAWTGGGAGSGAGTVAALIGAAGPVPAVDLRVGQAPRDGPVDRDGPRARGPRARRARSTRRPGDPAVRAHRGGCSGGGAAVLADGVTVHHDRSKCPPRPGRPAVARRHARQFR